MYKVNKFIRKILKKKHYYVNITKIEILINNKQNYHHNHSFDIINNKEDYHHNHR